MDQARPLSRAGAREIAERAAARLARHPRVVLVYLFGSGASSDSPGARDVDLAVLTEPPLTPPELLRLRADVIEAAGGPIDLVALHDASVVLAHEVVETGRCLYARSGDARTAFVTRALARYWDFLPYLREQWDLAARRAEERLRGAPA